MQLSAELYRIQKRESAKSDNRRPETADAIVTGSGEIPGRYHLMSASGRMSYNVRGTEGLRKLSPVTSGGSSSMMIMPGSPTFPYDYTAGPTEVWV